MGQYLQVGNEGFRAMLQRTYVDKTGLIAVINGIIGSKEKLVCVSRPRRFGKSYAAQMLCAYYDRSCDSRELFEGLEISKAPDFEKHLNRYPVIYIDMMMALSRKRLGSFWSSSEVYDSLRDYIDMNHEGLKDAIVAMLAGESCEVDTGSFQNDMTIVRSRDDVLTVLVHLGYLSYDSSTETVRIPNEEIRREFIRAVKNGERKELMELIQNSDRLLKYTLERNEKQVTRIIEQNHLIGSSPKFYNNEQSLRSIIRLSYISCVDQYQLIEELPGGKGYADMVYIPKKTSTLPALVIELKWNQDEETAISQIRERKYPVVLDGLAGEVLLVGINYNEETKEHSCKIERWEMRERYALASPASYYVQAARKSSPSSQNHLTTQNKYAKIISVTSEPNSHREEPKSWQMITIMLVIYRCLRA